MRYGIIADIHSNIEALDAVLKALDEERCDTILCLGDIIGYGANPKECLDRIRDRDIVCVAGNHDLAAVGKFDLNVFNSVAYDAMLYQISRLSAADQKFLASLPVIKKVDDITLVHSSPHKPDNFDYILTISQAEQAFWDTDTPVTFIGHSHVPAAFLQEPGITDYCPTTECYLRRHRQIIFNCGSVGQPRDGNCDPCYALYDTSVAKIRLGRVHYNVDAAAKKIVEAGLPLLLAERLYKGF